MATTDNLTPELRALHRLTSVFGAIEASSDSVDGVFLVGGTVRDILLGEKSFDVDIAVEGDAIGLAKELAEKLGGRMRVHDRFGTAVVLYGVDERVDVVTARTETYHAPGALPAVEHAAIRDDLERRDFTINAMAVSLGREDFGALVDPFGGRVDLAAGSLRVLHERSFVDDPTRIFRGIRYENRYGFRMDADTTRLAHACVERGLVSELSPARLRDELVLLLDEEATVDHSLERLAELGAAEAIHEGLAADSEAARLIHRGRALAGELEVGVPSWRIGLAALARNLDGEEVRTWLSRLAIRRSDAMLIAGAVSVGPQLVRSTRDEAVAASELVALAEPFAPDAPLFALALDDLPPLRRYFTELRHVRLEITGNDVAGLGLAESPRVGTILSELRRRKLDGELETRDSELAAASELIAAE